MCSKVVDYKPCLYFSIAAVHLRSASVCFELLHPINYMFIVNGLVRGYLPLYSGNLSPKQKNDLMRIRGKNIMLQVFRTYWDMATSISRRE